ncbi:class I adenylate-forming enzyme family protein [Kurthia sibirica]|uniref:AMP-dependent synthetase n=1 Tax=Kurthia sibirica TaxID=202750 RepID=A0A2U3ALT3_9BACL|nr:AMP-binding protein [Kurthia sibirica]PWI25467.1 AMP-dependent synthetase [Kurthia sibirica]GEK34952.1 long-chain-fatty-acid--CoA ligase [Kurthia sibirica]
MLKGMKNQPLDQYIEDYALEIPSAVALNFYGKEITYYELNKLVIIFSNYLQSIGIKKGDVVALYLQNCPQYIIAFYGAQRVGAIVGPCNPMFKEWELSYQLQDLEAKLIVTSVDLYPILHNIKDETMLQEIILIDYVDYLPKNPYPPFPEKIQSVEFKGTTLWQQIFNKEVFQRECERVAVNMTEDVAMIIYTSGTTGVPKGAMLTYKNSEYQAYVTAKYNDFSVGDKLLNVMPIFHIAGKLIGMMTPFIAGATSLLLMRFSPQEYLQTIEAYKPNFLTTTVPMNISMLEHPLMNSTDFSTIKENIAISFGIQLTEQISNDWQEIAGFPLLESGYGMTETHTLNSMTPKDQIKYGVNGRPTKGTTIKIVDATDFSKELTSNKRGMILLKGPSVFKGYKGREQETAHSFYGDFFVTGDMGLFDEDGFLVFLGRATELIKSSGYNVYPEEVEKMLEQHEFIKEVAVVGIPDKVRGESSKAFIVLKEGANPTEEMIISWAKKKMAAYKYPREVEFIMTLPKTNSGKVLRRILKDQKR